MWIAFWYLMASSSEAKVSSGGCISVPRFSCLAERPWDFRRPAGAARYACKVSLGFVEVLNNKISVIQRRAYDLRDEEYLCLKVLTCMLPKH